jgi:hypothetical protein
LNSKIAAFAQLLFTRGVSKQQSLLSCSISTARSRSLATVNNLQVCLIFQSKQQQQQQQQQRRTWLSQFQPVLQLCLLQLDAYPTT